jgi:hypothetical protein
LEMGSSKSSKLFDNVGRLFDSYLGERRWLYIQIKNKN